MSRREQPKKLFFSRTLDFLDHYLPEQAKRATILLKRTEMRLRSSDGTYLKRGICP